MQPGQQLPYETPMQGTLRVPRCGRWPTHCKYTEMFTAISTPLCKSGLSQKQDFHLALINQALCSTDMKI